MLTVDELRAFLTETGDRSPAMVLLAEELVERDWSTRDLAVYMGGTTPDEISVDELALDIGFACAESRDLLLTSEDAAKLHVGFHGPCTGQLWIDLHERWRKSGALP